MVPADTGQKTCDLLWSGELGLLKQTEQGKLPSLALPMQVDLGVGRYQDTTLSVFPSVSPTDYVSLVKSLLFFSLIGWLK